MRCTTTGTAPGCGFFPTIVEGLHHIDRGHEKLESKLRMLGAKVRREA